MKINTTILVIAGAISLVLLFIVIALAYNLFREIDKRKKERGDYSQLSADGDDHSFINAFKTNNNHGVPITCLTVNGQTDTFQLKPNHDYSDFKGTACSNTGYDRLRSSSCISLHAAINEEQETENKNRRRSVSASTLFDRSNNKITETQKPFCEQRQRSLSLFSNYDDEVSHRKNDKSRKTSLDVIQYLRSQGRKVSLADLRTRSASNTSRRSSDIVPPSIIVTDDECSSQSSSVSEQSLSDTSTIGIKHRLAKRRLSRQTCVTTNRNEYRKQYRKVGFIRFTTRYKESGNILVVQIQEVTIDTRHSEKEMNISVSLNLEPDKKQKQKTSLKKGLKQFQYNEAFEFKILNREDLKQNLLKIHVWNQSILKKTEKLGEVGIALRSIEEKGLGQFNVELFIQRSESSSASIQISLYHRPPTIVVTIKQIRNLPKCGLLGTYVSVLLFKDGQLLRQETSTKRNTNDLVYDETFDFDFHTDFSTPLTDHSLVVTVNSQSMVGKNQVIGHVVFNMASPQKTAFEQWKLLENRPYENHVTWHSLIDPDEL